MKTKLRVNNDIESVFNYFSRKDYLIKYFDQEKVPPRIISEIDSEFFSEDEKIKLIFEDDEIVQHILVDEIKIKPDTSIFMRISYGKIIDKSDFDPLSDNEANYLNEKFNQASGNGFHYTILFNKDGEYVNVVEITEVFIKNLFVKIFWLSIGFYNKIKQTNVRRRIKQEIEMIKK
ncbi:MAG: hypothetical protein DWQ02_16035 [Bacteroidetes bacterium]|nr:MAG: hypothetical protein DWQ02_16035 [Bacteroidota bacterium]